MYTKLFYFSSVITLLHLLNAFRYFDFETANKIGRGKGAENASHYGSNTYMEFCDIPNIHTMRKSAKDLSKLCQPRGVSDGETKFLSQLEETDWLKHVQSVLTSSVRLVEMMDRENTSVLIHCSDGWDRTAQIGAAAQIMMDPYYRTLQGLAVLIEKEWITFGHKFRDRLGHGKDFSTKKKMYFCFFE